jgi:Phytanoyl-CoA dioxygenase (PhyH)
MRTHDCAPTLNDRQVLEVCKTGFLMLPGVVPDEINRRAVAFLNEHSGPEPTAILQEPWFHEHVILNAQAAGAVRSLLGADFGLPILMSNHRVRGPLPAQNWHRDGGSHYGPELHYLQVFYYPEACTREMGPTELLPGSHFLFALQNHMAHYGAIRGSYHAVAPAGSIFLTVYSIWHRRAASTVPGLRNLLKYNYWRTVPPRGDWLADPEFDPITADYGLHGPTFRQQFRDCYDAAEMFFWLCGKWDAFRLMGGQGWPVPANFMDRPYGFPAELQG